MDCISVMKSVLQSVVFCSKLIYLKIIYLEFFLFHHYSSYPEERDVLILGLVSKVVNSVRHDVLNPVLFLF